MSLTAEQFSPDTANLPASAPPSARAAEPRVYGFFPARVRGVDAGGSPFQARTLIDNFGADEFELRLTRRVEPGRRLLVVADIHEATVALHCEVLCAAPGPDGSHLLTVAVKHHRFL